LSIISFGRIIAWGLESVVMLTGWFLQLPGMPECIYLSMQEAKGIHAVEAA
jgi:hypothetical protein